MNRRVLLVLPTGTYRASAFLAAAHRLNLDVVVASEEASTLGGRHPELELVVDLKHPETASAAVASLPQADRIEAVVAADESGVMTAAHLAETLDARGNPLAAARATRDKSRLRALLQQARVPQPEWALWAGEMPPPWQQYPAVVKPVDQAASRGVVRVDRARELLESGRRIRALVGTDVGCGLASAPRPPLLVEGFVPGPEVAAEALMRDGEMLPLVIYDKPEPLDGPYFEETTYTVPTVLPDEVQSGVWASVQAAVSALGLRTGPIHAELRLGAGAPRVIDLASRSIGGRCSRVLHFRSGMTLEEMILINAMGDPLPGAELLAGGFGVMMLPVPRAGRLRAVAGREKALAEPGVEGLEVTIPIGGWVEPPPSGDRYLGFLFARAVDGPAAARILAAAHSHLQFDIDEDAPEGG